jgi:hypothetical protein
LTEVAISITVAFRLSLTLLGKLDSGFKVRPLD